MWWCYLLFLSAGFPALGIFFSSFYLLVQFCLPNITWTYWTFGSLLTHYYPPASHYLMDFLLYSITYIAYISMSDACDWDPDSLHRSRDFCVTPFNRCMVKIWAVLRPSALRLVHLVASCRRQHPCPLLIPSRGSLWYKPCLARIVVSPCGDFRYYKHHDFLPESVSNYWYINLGWWTQLEADDQNFKNGIE